MSHNSAVPRRKVCVKLEDPSPLNSETEWVQTPETRKGFCVKVEPLKATVSPP